MLHPLVLPGKLQLAAPQCNLQSVRLRSKAAPALAHRKFPSSSATAAPPKRTVICVTPNLQNVIDKHIISVTPDFESIPAKHLICVTPKLKNILVKHKQPENIHNGPPTPSVQDTRASLISCQREKRCSGYRVCAGPGYAALTSGSARQQRRQAARVEKEAAIQKMQQLQQEKHKEATFPKEAASTQEDTLRKLEREKKGSEKMRRRKTSSNV